jgi:hypothetical protein
MSNSKAAGLSAVAVLALAGCGSGKHFANLPRPASPIDVNGAVNGARVVVSPSSFGAGLVNVTVANETGGTLQVSLVDKAGHVEGQTGPINPGDPGTFKTDLSPGTYLLKTDQNSIIPATLAVGAARPSAQNQLLQP